MEYGLRVLAELACKNISHSSLNPCFDGIWSARRNASDNICTVYMVLILVLMEYGLRVVFLCIRRLSSHCLNPCFDGIWSASYTQRNSGTNNL